MLSYSYLWHKRPGFKGILVKDVTGRRNNGLEKNNKTVKKPFLRRYATVFLATALCLLQRTKAKLYGKCPKLCWSNS